MSQIKKDIIKILELEGISEEFIDEIIAKSLENAIISLDYDKINIEKEELEKSIQKAEKKLKNDLKFEKVTIFLTSNSKKSQKTPKKTKNTEVGFLKKVKLRFLSQFQRKNLENSQKNTKIETKSEKLIENSSKKVQGVKKIIAVASNKGGVGKSTFAVNLAASLKRIGHNVAILDADIYGPSIPTLLDLKEKPQIENQQFIPLLSHSIKTMSIGFIIDENSAGVWRGAMITKILHQLLRTVKWDFDNKKVDYMIIDMPPGTGDICLSLMQNFQIDGAIIVSTPQNIAVSDAARSVDCFKKLGVKILGVVQNMAYLEGGAEKKYIFGRDGAKNMAKKFNLNFLGEIPISQEISDSNEEKIPFVIKNPSSKIAFEYGKIAEEIVDKIK